MKTIPSSRRTICQPNRSAAFTLIELLTVMAIILVLAGLILNIAGSASYNSAKARAQGEISGMSAALENYKADNGAYPENGDTDKLNAAVNFEPTAYNASCQYLYQELTGSHVVTATAPTPGGKAYLFLKSTQISGAVGDPLTYIIDPFGFSYGYSTKYISMLAASPGGIPVPATWGYNPTFDLWSTAGYSSKGKATPPRLPSPNTAAGSNALWVKNW